MLALPVKASLRVTIVPLVVSGLGPEEPCLSTCRVRGLEQPGSRAGSKDEHAAALFAARGLSTSRSRPPPPAASSPLLASPCNPRGPRPWPPWGRRAAAFARARRNLRSTDPSGCPFCLWAVCPCAAFHLFSVCSLVQLCTCALRTCALSAALLYFTCGTHALLHSGLELCSLIP
jgi:hypothetical protein